MRSALLVLLLCLLPAIAQAQSVRDVFDGAETRGEQTVVRGLPLNTDVPTRQVGTRHLRDGPATVGGTICPDLTGEPLLACLRSGYTRTTALGYDLARDHLYGRNGQTGFYTAPFVGVYTGRSGPLGGGASATQIDTEHTWPRSMMPSAGAQEGELHNLYPTISKANNDRGNLPFGEIDDALATGWYCPTGNLPQGAPPATDRDACSEVLGGVRFEPREDHKGNVARVLAYFATMYGPTATSSAFLRDVRPILVPWHRADPPDAPEVSRSAFIRTKQGNDNPYLLDTTLVRRAFAVPTGTAAALPTTLALRIAPSPTRGAATLYGTLPGTTRVSVTVFDALGRRVALLPFEPADGAFARTLDVSDQPPGVYFVHVRAEGAVPLSRSLTLVRAR